MKRYVIGDIHGCHHELIILLDKIYDHVGPGAIEQLDFKIIFVGDYVDRGSNSRGVVQLIRGMQNSLGNKVVALMGNHEDMILAGDYTYAAETFRSFNRLPSEGLEEGVDKWMRSLPKYYEDDTIIVAHAGVHPGLTMDDQPDNYLLWYRYPRNTPAGLPKHFYHGHTPTLDYIERAADRTNVDTGCVYGGHLTAAIVGDDGKPEGFIQVPKKNGSYDTSQAKERGWEIDT